MRLTPALYVRNLLAKLHPPLPKTPRESQQLLNILESSFRKHLDEIHPSPKAYRDGFDTAQCNVPSSSVDSSKIAHQYLTSVLTHPLLDRKNGRQLVGETLAGNSVSNFDRALVDNNVTASLLTNCLRDYAVGIRNGDRVSKGERLGPRISSWLYSISPEEKEKFFLNSETIPRVVPVMAADYQETTVWEWLRMLYERDFGGSGGTKPVNLSDPSWLRAEDSLVSALMRLSVSRGDLLDATQQFVEACQYRVDSGRATVDHQQNSTELAYSPMISSWKRLSASIIYARKLHGISSELFDAALPFGLQWSRAPHFSEPVLMVYHPTMPTSQLLCQKLRNVETAAIFLDKQKGSGKAMLKATLVALLDGAQLALDQRAPRDAQFLLEFASTHFSDLVPAPQPEQDVQDRVRTVLGSLKVRSLGVYRLGLT